MSRVKVCDPGEFIASFKPKKVRHCCLGCHGKIKYVSCWRAAVNSIKILAIRFNIRLKTASNRKNNTSLTSQAQKVVKVKTLVLEFMLGHVFFVRVIWLLRRAYLMSYYDWYFGYFRDISQHCRYEGRYFLGTKDIDIDMTWYISPFHFGIWILI